MSATQSNEQIVWSGNGTTILMKLTPTRPIQETWLLDSQYRVFAADTPTLGTNDKSIFLTL